MGLYKPSFAHQGLEDEMSEYHLTTSNFLYTHCDYMTLGIPCPWFTSVSSQVMLIVQQSP